VQLNSCVAVCTIIIIAVIVTVIVTITVTVTVTVIVTLFVIFESNVIVIVILVHYYCCCYYCCYCDSTIELLVHQLLTLRVLSCAWPKCTYTRHGNLASLRDLQQNCSRKAACKAEETRVDGIALTRHKTHCMTHVVAKQLRAGVSEQFHVAAACMNMQQCRGLTLKAVLLQQVTIQIAQQDLGKS